MDQAWRQGDPREAWRLAKAAAGCGMRFAPRPPPTQVQGIAWEDWRAHLCGDTGYMRDHPPSAPQRAELEQALGGDEGELEGLDAACVAGQARRLQGGRATCRNAVASSLRFIDRNKTPEWDDFMSDFWCMEAVSSYLFAYYR